MEREKRTVDVFGLRDGLLVVVAGFVDAFGTRQIDDVKLCDCPRIRPHLLGINLDDEDAVRAGRCIVLGSLRDHSVCVTDEK